MNLRKLRSKPGMSSAYTYKPGLIFAGPHGTYPLGYSKGTISPKRVRAALSLAHHSSDEKKLKERIANLIITKGDSTMKSLGHKILESIRDKRKGMHSNPDAKPKSKFGGNRDDIRRSAPLDYANFKDTDKGYKSQAFGGAHDDERRSAPRDFDSAADRRHEAARRRRRAGR